MTAITLNLDEGARALIDDWVRDGYYASVEEVVAAGLHCVREQIEASAWTPSAEDEAAIEQGLDDIAAGRVYPADEVFAELRARYSPR